MTLLKTLPLLIDERIYFWNLRKGEHLKPAKHERRLRQPITRDQVAWRQKQGILAHCDRTRKPNQATKAFGVPHQYPSYRLQHMEGLLTTSPSTRPSIDDAKAIRTINPPTSIHSKFYNLKFSTSNFQFYSIIFVFLLIYFFLFCIVFHNFFSPYSLLVLCSFFLLNSLPKLPFLLYILSP